MLTNCDVTVYHRRHDAEKDADIWEPHYIQGAWWHTSGKTALAENGLQMADEHVVRIPDTGIAISKDDYVVRGKGPERIDTIKGLAGMERIQVLSAVCNQFGGSPHVKVKGV